MFVGMGCIDACCNAIREGTLRFLNLVLFLLGMATLVYGVIVLAQDRFSIVVLTLLGIGFLLSLLSGSVAFMCHRNRVFLFLYMIIMTLLAICTIAAAVTFAVPGWRDNALQRIDDAKQRHKLQEYTKIASYAFMCLSLGMVFAVYLTHRQRNYLRAARDLDEPLNHSQRSEDLEAVGKSKTPKTDALRQQMHTRYAHLYDEYGQRKQGGGGDRTSQWA